jgi:hydrogenase maturation protease
MKKLVILGLGNSILSDDIIGLRILEILQSNINNPQISFETAEIGGLKLLDSLLDYDHAIVIDSIKTGQFSIGEVIEFSPSDFNFTPRSSMIHDVSFFDALLMAKKLDMKIPKEIRIVAVEIGDNITVSLDISSKVTSAIPHAIERIKEIIQNEYGYRLD